MSTLLSIITILSSLAVVVLSLFLRESSAPSYLILGCGLFGACTAVAALIATRREIARIKFITSIAAQTMLSV